MLKFKKFLSTVRYAGLTPNEIKMCRAEISNRNKSTLNWILPILTLLLALLLIVALIPGSGEENNKYIYGTYLMLFAAQIVVFKWFLLRSRRGILIASYIFMSAAYAFGIYQACFLGVESTSTPYCVLLVVVPLLVVDLPLRMSIVTVVVEVVLLIVHAIIGDTGGDKYLIINSISCTILGVCCSYSIQMTKLSDIRNHLMLEIQRDTDVMTGARSRVAYVRDLDMMSVAGKSAGFIFADVNGLKHTNDNYGHEAGDRLIRTAFALLRKHFNGATDGVYRIGGDEFMVITLGEEKKYFMARFDELVYDPLNNNIISCGCSWTSVVTDPESAIREAEKNMYDAKALFYRTHPERDRRK